MFENVGASTSRNPKGLHGLYRITLSYISIFAFYLFLLQKGFNMRIKEIHLLNVPPFADVMVKLLKMVLKPKLISRVSRKVLNWKRIIFSDLTPCGLLEVCRRFGGTFAVDE
jgi:hypothetical protein